MILTRFKAEHLAAMDIQHAQRWALPLLSTAFARRLEDGCAYTALVDGVPVAAAGLVYVSGTAFAWAWLARTAGRHMLALHRTIQAALKVIPEVYAYAASDFPQGCRWLALFGFQDTGERAQLAGREHRLYVRRCDV